MKGKWEQEKMEVIKKVNEKMVKNETRKHALKTGWWVAVEKGGGWGKKTGSEPV